jgi:uncharacterized membrane protein (Fun14 family)
MLTSVSGTIGGGFFGGLLIGYARKKVLKLMAVVVGFIPSRTSISTISTNSFF